jgi:ABC-2 type transport system permease protein
MWFVKNMAMRLSRVLLRCIPVLLFACFLPEPFGLRLPPNALCGILCPVSMLLGFLVLIAFSMLVYISAFYTLSSTGIRILTASLIEFLSGAIIPIPFFPTWLQPVIQALPFASIQNTPFLIYTGHLSVSEALSSMGIQLLWLIALITLGRCIMKAATRRVVVQGG